MRKQSKQDRAERVGWKERILVLRVLRAARGWTRLQVAKAAGLTLLRVAVRVRRNPYLELVEALGFRPGAVGLTQRFLLQLDKDRSEPCRRG